MNHSKPADWINHLSGFPELLLVFFIIIPLLGSCQSRQPREVLFIGNSLTYFHDMPAMVQEMLREKQIVANVQQCTAPGVSLYIHLNAENTIRKLNSQSWDYVVLQEGTVSALIPEAMQYRFKPTVIRLDSLIRAKGGRTMLYQAYPISMYPSKYCYPEIMISKTLKKGSYCSAELLNSDQEFTIIQNSYNELKKSIDGDLALVGSCFEVCKKKYPELMLFESKEDTHPSKLGSYLIACVFFRALAGEKVSGVKYSAGLDAVEVKKIKDVVDSNS